MKRAESKKGSRRIALKNLSNLRLLRKRMWQSTNKRKAGVDSLSMMMRGIGTLRAPKSIEWLVKIMCL
jgi:hypothetical protein